MSDTDEIAIGLVANGDGTFNLSAEPSGTTFFTVAPDDNFANWHDGSAIRNYLLKNGCTTAQADSKAARLLRDALVDGKVSASATTHEAMKQLQSDMLDVDRSVSSAKKQTDAINDELRLLDERLANEKAKVITDPVLMDGLNAFARILRTVKEEFGDDKMSENVIVAAIEAGSYGYWRSVMGPKQK